MRFFRKKAKKPLLFLFFTITLAGAFLCSAQDTSEYADEYPYFDYSSKGGRKLSEDCSQSYNENYDEDFDELYDISDDGKSKTFCEESPVNSSSNESSRGSSFVCCSGNSSVAYSDLKASIDEILRKNKCSHIGVEVYSTKKGKVIYARNQNELFIPASNTKLFSSLLAVETLGQNYQFETVLITDGKIKGSCIEGNLYVVGSGDPSLKSSDLRNLIRNLRKNGIRKIKGNFCIDNEIFDHEGFAPGTSIDCVGKSWFNLVESIVVDRKSVRNGMSELDSLIESSRLASTTFRAQRFFKSALTNCGVKLSGKIIFKQIPNEKNKQKIILRHKSKNLNGLIKQILKDSDNLYADCIFKRVGAAKFGFPGSWKKGANALKDFLFSKIGIQCKDFKVVDGSGLSRYNLVSPNQIVNLLLWAKGRPYFDNFFKILPISGVDGTLRGRMGNIAYKVRAKTGTLSGVSSLSGYIKTRSNDTLIFSILNNGFLSKASNTAACKHKVEDRICSLLARI